MKPIKNYEAAVQSFDRTQQSTPHASLFPQDVSTMINQFRRNTANPNNDLLKDPLAFPEIHDDDREVSFNNTNLTKKLSASVNTLNKPNELQCPSRRKSLSPNPKPAPRTWSDKPTEPPNSLLESVTQTFRSYGSAITSSISNRPKRTRTSPSPTTSQQPASRPRMTPCTVEDPLDENEQWERLATLKPTQPQKTDMSKTLKCLTCNGALGMRENVHKLAYAYCEKDKFLVVPCSTVGCRGWLPPTLRDGARRTCRICHHIYFRCGCRELHVVPATDVRYRCKNCKEQVCNYPLREP